MWQPGTRRYGGELGTITLYMYLLYVVVEKEIRRMRDIDILWIVGIGWGAVLWQVFRIRISFLCGSGSGIPKMSIRIRGGGVRIQIRNSDCVKACLKLMNSFRICPDPICLSWFQINIPNPDLPSAQWFVQKLVTKNFKNIEH